ncbi:MAG: hypothetical protein NZT61_01050 [Deltaproteobacteria bacterium]|nr:hypothetical protein [Deltaproteobacteria bacterium]MCX7952082.1 hypothetical protein [Deltaproteobacteria bacterium]
MVGKEEVIVEEVISSRYASHRRPFNWSQRLEGFDIVKITDGRVLKLYSNAQQDTPKKGWIIVIEPKEDYFYWTLYGFTEDTEVSPDEF